MHQRILRARVDLRGVKLSETFHIHRDFEALSIHTMVNAVEPVLATHGLLFVFEMGQWQKFGNSTVLEGIGKFINADDPSDVFQVRTVGEGIDGSDKGLSKALSTCRKHALAQALNLAVGSNNEASNEKTDPQQQAQPGPQAGPTMSGTPQQGSSNPHPGRGPDTFAKTADDYIRPAPNGAGVTSGAPAKMYTLQQAGVKARSVLGSGMLSNCWAIIQNTGSTQALDDWEQLNIETLKEFSADDPTTAGQLKKIADSKRHTLQEKGL